jgi:hypothetical protein
VARYDIWNLEVPETVEDHMWRHRITAELVDSVLDGDYIVRPNRPSSRAATHILIGRDRRGRCIAAPITETEVTGSWRVVTAWPCKTREWDELRRRG